MKYNSDIHRRKSIRLKNYDYSQNGMYFVTICSEGMQCIFGEIVDEKMCLNDAGKMVEKIWNKVIQNDKSLISNIFVIMPNHFHAIINIDTSVGAHPCGRPVGEIIGEFKSKTTNEYIKKVRENKFPSFEKRIWQRDFHDHIIRNEKSLEKIQDYIQYNPQNWKTDKFFK